MIAALLVVALQQPTAPPPPPRPTMQSPIAKAVVQPAEAAVTVGDTLRLSVSAFDSAGRPYTDYSSNWFTSGGFFEGGVDSTGLVTGGSTGTLNVTALVRPRSGGKPVTAIARITILPPPAARIELDPVPTKLYVGQSMLLTATTYAANDDRRYDQVAWTSDRTSVVAVSSDGRLVAKAAGKANVTATAGRATRTIPITVAANPVTGVSLDPARTSVRAGDVVPIKFSAKAGSRVVADAVPEWSLNPGSGQSRKRR